MNLQCRKCGELIEVPEEALSAKRPRVTCPGCSTRYRLQPRQDTTEADAASEPELLSAAQPDADEAALVADSGPATAPAPEAPERPPDISQPIFEPGQIVASRYRVIRFLAQGGMGEVYEVEDVELLQSVALKTISARMGEETGILDRFKREIALARTITHPNVSRIFDLGTHRDRQDSERSAEGSDDQINFLTMELLRGETLSELLRRRHRLSTAEALPLIEQMCAGLDAAHRARVVHRDLKSENVFLEGSSEARSLAECRVVLTDFGVARGTDAGDRFASQVTGLGIVGTPAYMAPEQVENKVITSQADLYSLGIVIYEMVTGCLPFDADSPLTTAVKRLREAPPPPHIHVPDLPAWWERAILRCLERRPDDRFPDAMSVVRALEKPVRPTLAGRSQAPRSQATTTSTAHPAAAPAKKRRAVAPRHPTGRLSDLPTEPSATDDSRPATSLDGTLHGGIAMGSGKKTGIQTRKGPLWLAGLAALVLAAIALLLRPDPDAEVDPSGVEPRTSVVVVGFENLSGHADDDWLSTALEEMLTRELSRGEFLRTLSGRRVAEAKLEAELGRLDRLGGQLGALRALLGCDFVVSGSFESLAADGAPGPLRLEVMLQDATRGTTRSTLVKETHADRLLTSVGELGDALREELGTGSAEGAPPLVVPLDPRAQRLHAQAKLSLDDDRPGAAQELLESAIEIEPGNFQLHSTLADVWEAKGFSGRAEAEARRAFDLATGLPGVERLVLEGRYRTLAEDWQVARGVYADLWQSYPDELNYGLSLAEAQIAAGAVDDALATLDQLRKLPAPLSADPRIDLAEAWVDGRGDRLEQQLQASERAAATAEALGARLLEARAKLSESEAHRRLGRPQDALVPARKARKIFLELGQHGGHALAAIHLARAEFDLGDLDTARERFEEALAVYRRIDDRRGTLTALTALAPLLERQGDLALAQERWEQIEAIQREFDDRRGFAQARTNLARLLLELDRLAEAAERLEASKDLWQELGPEALAVDAQLSAEVALGLGDPATALDLQREAVRQFDESDRPRERLRSQAQLAGILLDLGEIAEADAYLAAAQDLAKPGDDPVGAALIVYQHGRIAELRGDFDTASHRHEEALDLRSELTQQRPILASRLALARLDLDTGLPARAELLAREVRADAEDEGRRAEVILASAILIEALLDDRRPDEAAAVSQEAEPWADVENLEARLKLDLARARLEAETLPEAAPASDLERTLGRFDQLAEQAASSDLRPLAMLIQLHGAAVALDRSAARRDEVVGRLRVLETEARAAGLLYFANRAKVLVEYGA